jgi:hypothetical protein
MTAARYEFTPMTAGDLPPIRRWLETPDGVALLMFRDAETP